MDVNPNQLALTQNVAAVFSENNQVVLKEVDLTAQAMKEFMNEVREIINKQATLITALNGRVIQLETDKKDMVNTHKEEVAALKSLISTNQKKVTDTIVAVDTKHTTQHNALVVRYNNHRHFVNTTRSNTSSAKESEDVAKKK